MWRRTPGAVCRQHSAIEPCRDDILPFLGQSFCSDDLPGNRSIRRLIGGPIYQIYRDGTISGLSSAHIQPGLVDRGAWYAFLTAGSASRDRPPRLIPPVRPTGRQWACGLGDDAWESRAERRSRNLMIGTNKKRHRAIEVADPDFGGASVEVEGTFFVNFGCSVRRRKHFDTDFRSVGEEKGSLAELGTAAGQPGYIDGLDSIGGGYGALGHGPTGGKELNQQSHDLALAVSVEKTWRRSHENMSMAIGLDSVRELCESRICREFSPASQVEAGLRLKIRKLDRDRHAGKIRQLRAGREAN